MTNFISQQGRKALDKVATWLENGATHVDIDGRVLDKFDMNYAVNDNGCGTSCCVAGAICQFEKLGNPNNGSIFFDNIDGIGAGQLATEYLGISEEDAERLFMPWENYEFEYNEFLANNAKPFSDIGVAARTIRAYLATGVIDWEAAGLQMDYSPDDNEAPTLETI